MEYNDFYFLTKNMFKQSRNGYANILVRFNIKNNYIKSVGYDGLLGRKLFESFLYLPTELNNIIHDYYFCYLSNIKICKESFYNGHWNYERYYISLINSYFCENVVYNFYFEPSAVWNKLVGGIYESNKNKNKLITKQKFKKIMITRLIGNNFIVTIKEEQICYNMIKIFCELFVTMEKQNRIYFYGTNKDSHYVIEKDDYPNIILNCISKSYYYLIKPNINRIYNNTKSPVCWWLEIIDDNISIGYIDINYLRNMYYHFMIIDEFENILIHKIKTLFINIGFTVFNL
jgi:hypothetical protein